MNNRIHIIIHCLPREIDGFERTLNDLHRSSHFLYPHDEVVLDCTLNLSEDLINWENSKIPKEYFIERWKVLEKKSDWTKENHFSITTDNSILGCNDTRRNSIRKYSDTTTHFMYLDCDIFFPQIALYYVFRTIDNINNEYTVITPELMKLWDDSWDILSNKKYKNTPGKIWQTYDHYGLDALSLEEDINITPIPQVKFLGGLFTTISSNLLKYIDIPDSFPGYGLDDTFVMECANIMKQSGYDVCQYKMENIISMENRRYKGEEFNPYCNLIDDYTMDERGQVIKKKFRDIAIKNYPSEIQKFTNKIKNA